MANSSAQNTGFALIVIGFALSFGREYLSEFYIRFYGWLRKQPPKARLKPAVMIYLMLTGMTLTVVGIMVMFNVLKW